MNAFVLNLEPLPPSYFSKTSLELAKVRSQQPRVKNLTYYIPLERYQITYINSRVVYPFGLDSEHNLIKKS
jgi:hypothetical protein